MKSKCHYLFLQPLISSIKCIVICFLDNKILKFLLEWKTFTPWNIIHLSSYIASVTLYSWHVKYETHHCICLNDAVFCIAALTECMKCATTKLNYCPITVLSMKSNVMSGLHFFLMFLCNDCISVWWEFSLI